MPESPAPSGTVSTATHQQPPGAIRCIHGLLYVTTFIAGLATVAALIAYSGASDAFAAQYAEEPEAFITGLFQVVALIAVTLITVVWLQIKATGGWQFGSVSTAIVAGASLVVAITQANGITSSTMPGLLVHPTLLGSAVAAVMLVTFSLLITPTAKNWYASHES